MVGLLHSVNDGVAEVTSGLPSRVVAGRDWIEERVAGVTLRLSAGAFFQTNTAHDRHALRAAWPRPPG